MPMRCERSDIKIFVSRRIDIDSTIVDNPLYVPVRCGAVFGGDDAIQGDNIGDNISHKRNSFCEFTVQYWAWKNVQADYYGLCHYRRYLSFGEKTYLTNEQGLVPYPILSKYSMERFGLLDAAAMSTEITKYDLIVSQPAPVKKMPLPHGKARNVRQLWEAHDGIFFEKKVIDRMFQLIDELAPEYMDSAEKYFNSEFHRGYNCYIMRRPLFERLCKLQFSIMEVLEKELDTAGYTSGMMRTPAYVGEMLYGIFLYHVITCEQWNVGERQLVLFYETCELNPVGRAKCYLNYWIDHAVRIIAAPFFPLGSRRREICKAAYYRLTRDGRN